LGLLVVVTHPFHLLRGERLVVLFVRRVGTGRIYVCEGGPLGSVALPEDATDRGAEPAERPLSIEVLAGLVALVGELDGRRGGGAMSAARRVGSAGPSQCPAFARELAGRLSVLFERDVEIARRLNDPARRLRAASESETALQQAPWMVDRPFHDYQFASEERRQLAAEIGEVIRRFVDVLVAAGWSEEQARAANVYELAGAGVR
jgi:hypothetical protein